MTALRQRHPRQFNDGHLAFVRSLPCLICGDNVSVEAAHVRYMDPTVAKSQCGIGMKPSDFYCVPLCGSHHREQHAMKERTFWTRFGIDPVKKALALYADTGDFERGCEIVRQSAPSV